MNGPPVIVRLAGLCLLALLILPVPALAGPGYHDYTQYTHWIAGFFTDDDLVTSVTSCNFEGGEHIAVTSRDQGLSILRLTDDALEKLGDLPLPGIEQGVVFVGSQAYVIASPSRLTKVLAWSPEILIEQWTDLLPYNPEAITALGQYLLIAAGNGGLLVYDPSESFNLPIGVVAQWPGTARAVTVLGTTAAVLTDAGLTTLDLSDPLAPEVLDSFALGDPLVMQVQDQIAYVAVGEDILELDLSDPAAIQLVGTLTDLVDFPGTYPLKALALDETGIYYAASRYLLHYDLSTGQVDWRGSGSNDLRQILVTDHLLALAAGSDGCHAFARRPAASAPATALATSKPFHALAPGFLFYSDNTTLYCQDLRGAAPQLAWTYQDEQGAIFKRVFAAGDRLFVADTTARVHLLDYTYSGVSEVGVIDTGGALVLGMGMMGSELAVLGDLTDGLNADNHLLLYDISEPAAPDLLSALPINPYSNLLAEGDLAVLWDSGIIEAGIRLVDCSDRTAPVFGTTLGTPDYSRVSRQGDLLYVTDGRTFQAHRMIGPNQVNQGPIQAVPDGQYFTAEGSVGYLAGAEQVFDLSDPLTPRAMGAFPIPGGDRTVDVMVSGEYLVAMDSSNFYLLPAHATGLVPVEPTGPPPTPTSRLIAVPNPFNPRVSLEFSLPRSGPAEIDIFDLRGRRVARLGRWFPAGDQTVTWEGTDGQGRDVPSGLYLARVMAHGYEASHKLVLAR